MSLPINAHVLPPLRATSQPPRHLDTATRISRGQFSRPAQLGPHRGPRTCQRHTSTFQLNSNFSHLVLSSTNSFTSGKYLILYIILIQRLQASLPAQTIVAPCVTLVAPALCIFIYVLNINFQIHMPPKTDWTQAQLSSNTSVRAELDRALSSKTAVNYRPQMETLTTAPWRTGAVSSVLSLYQWLSNRETPLDGHSDVSPEFATKLSPQGASGPSLSSEIVKHLPGFSLPTPIEWTVRYDFLYL